MTPFPFCRGNVFPLLADRSSRVVGTTRLVWICLFVQFFIIQHVPLLYSRLLLGSRLIDNSLPRIVHNPSDVVVRAGSPATLSCRAEGNPEPTIQWLRNGLPLDTDRMDVESRPIVLPEGSLFFFSVSASGRKSQSHEAVYACVARSSAGVATSRNASLHIAGLNHDGYKKDELAYRDPFTFSRETRG